MECPPSNNGPEAITLLTQHIGSMEMYTKHAGMANADTSGNATFLGDGDFFFDSTLSCPQLSKGVIKGQHMAGREM